MSSHLLDSLRRITKRAILHPIYRLRGRMRRRRRHRLIRQLTSQTHGIILTGPFAGLSWPVRPDTSGSYLLGTYERELWPIVNRVIDANYEHLVNVGAGSGYYAVGFLHRCPTTRVTAFEALSNRREAIMAFATKNDVSQRLAPEGSYDADRLRATIRAGESTVLWVDIEGGERELLDPTVLPVLRTIPILVEVHDFHDPAISRLLKTRFASTHNILAIQQEERRRRDLPAIKGLSDRSVKFLAGEGRPARMTWLWMQPQ